LIILAYKSLTYDFFYKSIYLVSVVMKDPSVFTAFKANVISFFFGQSWEVMMHQHDDDLWRCYIIKKILERNLVRLRIEPEPVLDG